MQPQIFPGSLDWWKCVLFSMIDNNRGQAPTKGLFATQRFALGAIFVYLLAVLYRFENGLDLCLGLKAFLKAA